MDQLSINEELLKSPSHLYNIFAPTRTMELADIRNIRRFFENNGGEFNYTIKQLKMIRFFYFVILGYTPEYNMFWFLSQIYSADKKGVVDTHTLVYLTQDSMGIDKFLLDFFEFFPSDRLTAPIKNPKGTLHELIIDGGEWFESFSGLFLEECRNKVKIVKKKLT